MEKISEPKRCFHCGNGHVKIMKDKVKVNGKPENICKECYNDFQNKE